MAGHGQVKAFSFLSFSEYLLIFSKMHIHDPFLDYVTIDVLSCTSKSIATTKLHDAEGAEAFQYQNFHSEEKIL